MPPRRSPTPLRLDSADIEAIAVRVAELLGESRSTSPTRLVDAATVADMLGVDRDWVYENAGQLGAVRLGGPRGRLRFDLVALQATLGRETATPLAVQLAGRRRSSPRRARPGGG